MCYAYKLLLLYTIYYLFLLSAARNIITIGSVNHKVFIFYTDVIKTARSNNINYFIAHELISNITINKNNKFVGDSIYYRLL